MIKTQVQIPDYLHREAKRIAAEYEMSFAEVVRRGLERVVVCYPHRTRPREWRLPVADVGRVRVPLERLRAYATDEETTRSLPRRRRDSH